MRTPLLIAVLLATSPARAQTFTAALDTAMIRIGEQAVLTLTYRTTRPISSSLIWPTVNDTLERHVEVADRGKVDSLTSNGEELLQQRFAITSFDSGVWVIPSFVVTDGEMRMETRPMVLDVRGVEVDVSKGPRPMKPRYEVPFSLWSWIKAHRTPIGLGLIALAAIAGILLLLSRKRSTVQEEPAPAPLEPIHVRFTRALKELEAQRLWQQGDHKAYHSQVTDLVRGYIEERYRVPALESTTDELLNELRVSALPADERIQLENMLRVSDLVKFAKARPTPSENEQLMAGALRFITVTAPSPNVRPHEA